MHIEPIGYFHSSFQSKYDAPRQSGLAPNSQGMIQLDAHCQFEQALEDLAGFDRIWVVFHFHLNQNWKPKVRPPRSHCKRGVFATRSPHRPNFIGLSCLELKSISGLMLFVANHDLIDGTPILDIKPYLNETDAIQSQRQGWIDELKHQKPFTLHWSPLAREQVRYLNHHGSLDLDKIQTRLALHPFPNSHNRIEQLDDKHYSMAYKTWRIFYFIEDQDIYIQKIRSGYNAATLKGIQISRWADVPLHIAFMHDFYSIDEGV